MNIKRLPTVFSLLVLGILLLGSGTGLAATGRLPAPSSDGFSSSPSQAALSGWFSIRWGDGPSGSGVAAQHYILQDDQGKATELRFEAGVPLPDGGLLSLNRQRVVVTGWYVEQDLLQVETIRLEGEIPSKEAVIGPQPWVSVLCKFSDVPDEPNAPPYFQEMFASDYPGLDHYWREQSFDLANLTGSEATDQWYTLPHTRTYYLPGGSLDWWTAAQDCTAVGDGEIDYTSFVGINLMFNDLLDCCAWGGSWYACLDGECRWWSITWEPPWGYQNIGVIAHENGHGFGLPHSSGDYGETYDNAWDVMSDVWSNGARGGVHPVYGVMGQHTISYHKDLLGWITDTLRVEVPVGTWATVSLEQLALPQTQDSLIAVVPIDNSPNIFYTVEARRLAGYDGYLPGNAVIIHEVQLGRDNPAHVVDIDGNGDTGDAGAMWLPGETFIDAAADIEVAVLEETASGFVVAIKNRVIELTGLVLDGPAAGSVGATIPFTATVTPPNATLPVTYTWQTPGQPPMMHVGGISDTVEFTWNVVGSYPLTVTATNPGSTFTQTQTIDIYIPPQTLELDGPTTGLSGAELAFEAAVGPISVTQPVTYLWQISGRAPVTHTGGLTDSLSIVWAEPGPQTVTLTASNPAASVTATQEVMILGPLSSLQIQGPEVGALGQVYTFTASVTPLTATQPVTYVWQVSDGRQITHTAGLSDTAAFSWETPGAYTLTVAARNAASTVYQDFSLGIYWAPAQVEINAAARDYVGAESAYIAAVKPVTGTAPLTYVWQVDDGVTITHTSGVTDTLRWTWLEPGAHTLTLVVKNVAGQVMGSLETEAYYRIVLPVVMRLMH